MLTSFFLNTTFITELFSGFFLKKIKLYSQKKEALDTSSKYLVLFILSIAPLTALFFCQQKADVGVKYGSNSNVHSKLRGWGAKRAQRAAALK